MDIDRARTFLEIVHCGSFRGAADRLHVTQTTVSARIRTLEEAPHVICETVTKPEAGAC